MTLFPMVIALAALGGLASEPLRLHPENPYYFLFDVKPTILMTSGEHYGAVLNLDFDFPPYLDELQKHGLNLTRTFSGTYREVPGSFNIKDNTLAPVEGRYCAPWAVRDGKYDLDAFNEGYFQRLKDFMTEAAKRGIVVEYVLFCPFYEDILWKVNPQNPENNVNQLGTIGREEAYTLKHPKLLERQLAFVRRVVAELNEFDNLYFEICNEPYFGGVTLDWQRRVADEITATEKNLPKKHLIAQNIANEKARVEDPNPAVSIFNFHYASPPVTIAMNRDLRKPIVFDETGFKGTKDEVYRRQAWEFMLAGGSGFSNLDYSFTADHEDGSMKVEDPTPGGGGASFRRQIGFLKSFLDAFDLIGVEPTKGFIAKTEPAEALEQVCAIANQARGRYGIYLSTGRSVTLELKLPEGGYRVEWFDPRDGKSLKQEEIRVPANGDQVKVASPRFDEDAAVSVKRLP